MAGWLAGWLDGWLVGWRVGWLVGRLTGWMVGWLLVGRLAGWLAERPAGRVHILGIVHSRLYTNPRKSKPSPPVAQLLAQSHQTQIAPVFHPSQRSSWIASLWGLTLNAVCIPPSLRGGRQGKGTLVLLFGQDRNVSDMNAPDQQGALQCGAH